MGGIIAWDYLQDYRLGLSKTGNKILACPSGAEELGEKTRCFDSPPPITHHLM